MSEKQNAVEWLIEQIKEYDFSPRDNTYLIEIPSWIFKEKIDIAKELEKQQIIDAFEEGKDIEYEYHINDEPRIGAEQYYKEIFNK
jgi:hypothetical protein